MQPLGHSRQCSHSGTVFGGRAPGSQIAAKTRNWSRTSAHLQAPVVELEVRSFEGQASGKNELKLTVADAATAKGLVHRHVVMIQQNARQGSANTKTRAEVRGGGRKPLQQKGTGNARQGSRRTPLKPGGGVVFGPKPVDWSIKMNKKERRLAIATALHSASASITVVEDFASKVSTPKTKALLDALKGLGVDVSKQHVLMIVDELTDAIQRSGRNVDKLEMTSASTLNTYDILRADQIILDQPSLNFINEFYGQ